MRKGKTLSNPSLRKTLGLVGQEVAVRIAGLEPAPGFWVGVSGVGGPDITPFCNLLPSTNTVYTVNYMQPVLRKFKLAKNV